MPDVLAPSDILLGVDAPDRDSVLKVIAEHAVTSGRATEPGDVLSGLLAREAESSTALMDGFAIPHAKHANITATGLVVLRTQNPVDWDGEPSDIFLAMLVPEAEGGTTHLKLLAQVSRALIDETLRADLRAATTAADVYALLKPKIAL